MVGAHLRPDVFQELLRLAGEEQRTVSSVIERLLSEAMQARRDRQVAA